MALIGRGYVWPVAAGTPADPTAAYVLGPEFSVGPETELACRVAVTVAEATALEMRLDISVDAGTTWTEHSVHAIPGATVATHAVVLSPPEHCLVRLAVRRIGGGATTRVSVYAQARRDQGKGGRYGQPPELAVAGSSGMVCLSNAGAVLALDVAHTAGPWLPVGPATEAMIRYTLSGGPTTSCDVKIDWSPDGGTTVVPLPAVNAIAAGSVDHDDALYVGPGSNGEHMVPLVTVTPGTHIRVSAKRTGAAVNGLFRAYLYRVAV